MSEEFNFEKLSVYRKASEFTYGVYTLTQAWPKQYLFDITSQFRRAALSITLNIAEGSGRSRKDFQRFIDIARSSCLECKAILEIAQRLGLLDDKQYNLLNNELIELAKMLSGLKKSLNK